MAPKPAQKGTKKPKASAVKPPSKDMNNKTSKLAPTDMPDKSSEKGEFTEKSLQEDYGIVVHLFKEQNVGKVPSFENVFNVFCMYVLMFIRIEIVLNYVILVCQGFIAGQMLLNPGRLVTW